MILWVDDVRPAPNDTEYVRIRTVSDAIFAILFTEKRGCPYTALDLDHDAGDYASEGGDYIKILDWLEETGRNYPIRIHSQNSVGVQNMRRIIQHNGWKEIF